MIEYPVAIQLDFTETALYSCLHLMGELGDGAIVRAGEGYIREMTVINGHRHALGLADIKFEPLRPDLTIKPSSYRWEVEVNDKIMCHNPTW